MTDLLIIDSGTRIVFRSRLDDLDRYASVTGFAGYSNGMRQYLIAWERPTSPTEHTGVLAEDEFDIVPVTPPSMHHIAKLGNNEDFDKRVRDALS